MIDECLRDEGKGYTVFSIVRTLSFFSYDQDRRLTGRPSFCFVGAFGGCGLGWASSLSELSFDRLKQS